MSHRSLNNFSILCSLSPSDLTAKSLNKAEVYQKSNLLPSIYIQIKKCSDATCFYWLEHPVCLPSEIFESLSFLHLPLLDGSKEKFSALDGQAPSDKDRPSRVPAPSEESKAVEKGRKPLLVCGKVRNVIICGECHKPRCV